jgi:2-isopropylmalate synthase
VANSLAAVHEGVVQVQGTVNGYGERCGNANLCSVIVALEVKMGRKCLPPGGLSTLTEVSRFVAEVTNQAPDDHQPYVGKSAFAHKGGIHVAAMRRNESTYQHLDPALVGNRMRVVVSELSGRGNLLSKAEELGLAGADMSGVLGEIKDLESKGFSFEAAEASVAMMMKRQEPGYQPPFELLDFLVNVEHRTGRGIFAEAMVKVRVDGEVLHTAAEGSGPVDALDAALRKALAPRYPRVGEMKLTDYKVRILDSDRGTGAVTRVLIDTHMGDRRWSTVGASSNIIEASWRALSDSVEYGLSVAGLRGASGEAT